MPEKRLLKELNEKALASPRKRAVFMLSEVDADKQIMLNYFLNGSYLRPHRHNRPEQFETLSALLGTFAIVKFDDVGNIKDIQKISNSEMVNTTPKTWHTVVCLTD